MSIQYRCAALGCLYLSVVGSSSVVQLGDNANTKLTSRALAVQRAVPNFEDDEYRFAAYSIFFKPKLTLQPGVDVAFQSCSKVPDIRIGTVKTLGITASSLLRAGSGGPLQAETRIKHIRHFNKTGTYAEK